MSLHSGFEDYAKPIIDAIDPQREFIKHTLFRDSTLATEHYQCVKDMNRINRPLEVCFCVFMCMCLCACLVDIGCTVHGLVECTVMPLPK